MMDDSMPKSKKPKMCADKEKISSAFETKERN